MKKLYKLQNGIGKTGGGAIGSSTGAAGSGVPIGSAAAGAIGGSLPKGLTDKNLSDKSVRPWIFNRSRRLRQAGLKRHEIRYMDLTEREAQIIRKKARPKRSGRTEELSGSKFHDRAYEDFLGEIVSGDSDGTVQVKKPKPFFNNKAVIIGAVTGLIFSLLVLIIF